MCFSAPVSFATGSVLAMMGVALVSRVKDKRFLWMAATPFGFAAQQFAEGILWLEPSEIAKYIYMLLAACWPFWIAFILAKVEKNRQRKLALYVCMLMGLVNGVVILLSMPQVEVVYYHNSLKYFYERSESYSWNMYPFLYPFFYGLPIAAAWLLSTIRGVWIYGIVGPLAGISIYMIDQNLMISLWCFFVALMSLGFFWIIPKKLS